MVRVAVADPVKSDTDIGLRARVVFMPGRAVTLRSTLPAKLLRLPIDIMKDPNCPCGTDNAPGNDPRVKSGAFDGRAPVTCATIVEA
jgi:hypothetical protein